MKTVTAPAAPAEGAPATWRAAAVEAGRPRPFADLHESAPGRWQADFAIFGAVTTLLATTSVLIFVPELIFAAFIVGATLGAGVGGAIIGRFWHDYVRERLQEAGVARGAFAAAVMGAFWGAGAGAIGGVLLAGFDHGTPGGVMIIGALFGAIAGAIQCAWFAPAYALSVARKRLLILATLASPLLGWLALGFVLIPIVATLK